MILKNGYMDGLGILRMKDGTTVISTWEEKLLNGTSSVVSSDSHL
jgi:hypothetical protein